MGANMNKDNGIIKMGNANFQLKEEDKNFDYQKSLTEKLDNISEDFNQQIINEIILWKVNRYAKLEEKCFNLINQITETYDLELTKRILKLLLETKGIRLPMASTILRFKNPKIYQIIDQRVYRIIFGEPYKTKSKIEENINKYLMYLERLKEVAKKLKIPFEESDRILYSADKRLNKNIPIKY